MAASNQCTKIIYDKHLKRSRRCRLPKYKGTALCWIHQPRTNSVIVKTIREGDPAQQARIHMLQDSALILDNISAYASASDSSNVNAKHASRETKRDRSDRSESSESKTS
jgi:hypothetical protein